MDLIHFIWMNIFIVYTKHSRSMFDQNCGFNSTEGEKFLEDGLKMLQTQNLIDIMES